MYKRIGMQKGQAFITLVRGDMANVLQLL
jgi:hypothetical protein